KNMVRQVQSDRSNLAHGWLPFAADSIRQQFGTQMPQGGHPRHPSITSSASCWRCKGTSKPSALAVLRLIGLLTLQRKRTGGNQHVTVKHIHQQVNVTEGGQAVVAGDTVTRGPGERRRGVIVNNEHLERETIDRVRARLEASSSQQFVIDNRPGGGTNIGTEAVVRARITIGP